MLKQYDTLFLLAREILDAVDDKRDYMSREQAVIEVLMPAVNRLSYELINTSAEGLGLTEAEFCVQMIEGILNQSDPYAPEVSGEKRLEQAVAFFSICCHLSKIGILHA